MRKYLIILLFCFALYPANRAYSDFATTSLDDLKVKIDSKASQIKELDSQIANLNQSVQQTVAKKQTLSAELKQIDAVKNKLASDIKSTTNRINSAQSSIAKLQGDIGDKNSKIDLSQKAIADSLSIINGTDDTSMIEAILAGDKISAAWNNVSNLEDLQSKTIQHVKDLESIKRGLETDKTDLEQQKKKFVNLSGQLTDQKKIAEQNIAQKNKLINDTNNKEVNYRKLLADTQARRQAVADELSQYESQLKTIITPGSLPSIGNKVLAWPLDLVRITQYFGDTEFSKTQAIYNGHGHPGIDLGASIGTPLKAAGSGVVIGAGDTDPVCYKASYGKWIMIDHQNGLGTIYGHLSLVKVAAGDRVNIGDLIGYTGSTGYATGPHLHFGVVATQAVKIGTLKSKVKGCGTYTIPLGSLNGYLNPLSYL